MEQFVMRKVEGDRRRSSKLLIRVGEHISWKRL